MVEEEFAKNALPETFAEKVITLTEILTANVGQEFEFLFANGVNIRTRVQEVVRDSRGVHFLVCGPTRFRCHREPGSYPESFDSFVLIPSALVNVRACGESANVAGDEEMCPGHFEIAGRDQPTYGYPEQFSPLPTATGPLDLSDKEDFGFIRLGGRKRPFKSRDQEGRKQSFPVAPDDIYVHVDMIREHHLKQGDIVTCSWRRGVGNEHFPGAVEIIEVKPPSKSPKH